MYLKRSSSLIAIDILVLNISSNDSTHDGKKRYISQGAEPKFVGSALVRAKKLYKGVFFSAESDF